MENLGANFLASRDCNSSIPDDETPTSMEISARVESSFHCQQMVVQTEGVAKEIQLPSKLSGFGSAVNGGELLVLALATCFCNDVYREASKRNLAITKVDVVFTAEFDAEGEPGRNFSYKVDLVSDASAAEIEDLIKYVDRIAEVHNTIRKGVSVTLIS